MAESSNLPLKGHVALVTGATGGIGAATCRLLASLGCSIGIHYNSDIETAEKLQDEFKAKYTDSGAKFFTSGADMGNYDEVRAMHAFFNRVLGPPTILINNAGSTSGHSGVKSITDVPIEDFEKTWRMFYQGAQGEN
jgi:3-oxoacyl-[acyl-carrier protein] reductase